MSAAHVHELHRKSLVLTLIAPLDPQIGNVILPRLASERPRGSGPLPCSASSPRPCGSGKTSSRSPHRAEQAGEVDEVLGNYVDDLPLSLHLAATPDHGCRENEPALPFEQGRPKHQEFATSVASSSVINRTPLADPGRWRTSTSPATRPAATITPLREIARRHVTVGREVPSQECHGVRAY